MDTITGEAFSIAYAGPIARARVWRRTDMTADEGAAMGVRFFAELTRSLSAPRSVRSFIFDGREATEAVGPVTRRGWEEFLSACAAHGTRISIIVGPSATQRLQFTSICSSNAPGLYAIVTGTAEADAWAIP